MGCYGYGGFGAAGGHYGFNLFGAGLGLISHLIFLVLIFLAAWYLYKLIRSQGGQSKALAILEERYAKGEITIEEFQTMKKQLH